MENLSTWGRATRWDSSSNNRLRTTSVAIISDERFPHYATNTQQVVKNADALAGAGLPSDLVIPVQWKGLFRPGYDVAGAISQHYNVPRRISIKKIPTIPASNLRIEKITHCIAALIYASIRKYDVIYTRNEFTAILSVLLGKKTVFETYRKFGDEYPRIMHRLSKYARKPAFLGMILHSRLSFDSMRRAGFPAEKLAVFHNGFDYADMQPMLTKAEAREKLGWEKGKRYVVYTGNLQINKGIESVIDIAGKMPAVKFMLAGGIPDDIKRLQNYAEQHSVGNVIFTGFQPIKEVSCYLYAADALIIPPVSAPLEKYGRTVLPFKTFLYLAAGRPVLAPLQSDLTEVLEDGYNALLVEPDNLEAAEAALTALFANPAMHLRISENAAASVSDLTWDARAKKIIHWLTNAFHGHYPVVKKETQTEQQPAVTAV
jgi:glycosyltransferase involved in cell wall biosynthesis